MRIGFTGTRRGMTQKQLRAVRRLLADITDKHHRTFDVQAHHGDCVGADEGFHRLALKEGLFIVVHPPDKDVLRAFCKGYHEIRKPLPYLERNRNIVAECDLLIATPDGPYRLNSGTWHCAGHARAKMVANHVILPDGTEEATTYEKKESVK